jgi:hypothetical protein
VDSFSPESKTPAARALTDRRAVLQGKQPKGHMMAKIHGAELEALRARIELLDTPANRAPYLTLVEPVRDIDVRYRWDLFWAADGMQALNADYTDDHIDTALRTIVPALTREGSAFAA